MAGYITHCLRTPSSPVFPGPPLEQQVLLQAPVVFDCSSPPVALPQGHGERGLVLNIVAQTAASNDSLPCFGAAVWAARICVCVHAGGCLCIYLYRVCVCVCVCVRVYRLLQCGLEHSWTSQAPTASDRCLLQISPCCSLRRKAQKSFCLLSLPFLPLPPPPTVDAWIHFAFYN
ncbi:UNVERIFIED_CONTAM: hypothetical protein K2H54_036145 [Gekko kuhli]